MAVKRYYKTDAEDGAEIKVTTHYNLGGINYFNYKEDLRGYYVTVQRVVRGTSEGGFFSESFMVGQGFKEFLKQVARQSKKAAAEADAIALAKADELAARLAEREGLVLTGEVT